MNERTIVLLYVANQETLQRKHLLHNGPIQTRTSLACTSSQAFSTNYTSPYPPSPPLFFSFLCTAFAAVVFLSLSLSLSLSPSRPTHSQSSFAGNVHELLMVEDLFLRKRRLASQPASLLAWIESLQKTGSSWSLLSINLPASRYAGLHRCHRMKGDVMSCAALLLPGGKEEEGGSPGSVSTWKRKVEHHATRHSCGENRAQNKNKMCVV